MSFLHSLTERLGAVDALEAPADKVGDAVRSLTASRPVKNALSGTWLGHRLHPLLTDAVIGTWLSAGLLDAVGGDDAGDAADTLVAAGVVAAIPTAASGASDYADLYGRARRIAFVHLAVNDLALVLQATSWWARRRGHRTAGRLLSLGALAATGVGGYLGGHLSYAQGVGVDHTAFHEGPEDWTATIPAAEVTDQPRVVEVAEREILLVRDGDVIVALDNRCTHAGWPIAEGPIEDGCITCPHHGSVFRLTGEVVRGPAASPQPRHAVRVRDGVVEVRADPALSS